MICDVSKIEAGGIAKAFCLYFNLPKTDITFTSKHLIYNGAVNKDVTGLYHWLTHKIELKTPVSIFTLLHELTHHLQSHDYGNNDNHGENFNKARSRVITWARDNVCPCINNKLLNMRGY